jgi:predicted RNA binding protein YcfA (HicA-like mRNA interferase family)
MLTNPEGRPQLFHQTGDATVAGSLPVLKPREVAALLERLGFVETRQRGSHRQYRHADGPGHDRTFHGSRDISPTLLRKIARDIGLTVEELLRRR